MGEYWRTGHRFKTFQLTRGGDVESLYEIVQNEEGNYDCDEDRSLNGHGHEGGQNLEGRI